MITGRLVLIVELVEGIDGEDLIDADAIWDAVKVLDVRHYDMKDEEQVAIQVTRELIMVGKKPNPDRIRYCIMGGDFTVTAERATTPSSDFPVSRVPYSIWKPVPPEQPMWRAKKIGGYNP